MADEEKKSGGGDEWYIWLFGGLLVIGLLGGALGGVTNFMSDTDEGVAVVDTEITTDSSVELGVESGHISFGTRVKSSATAVDGFENWFDKFTDWLATFSLFDAAPTLVLWSMVISALSLIVILYSSLRTHWIMVEWDKEVGYNQAKEDRLVTRYYTNPIDRFIGTVLGIGQVDERQLPTADAAPESDEGPKTPVVTEEGVSGNPEYGDENGDGMIDVDEVTNPKWEHIKELIERPDESAWRQAILEADIMLDELLTNLNYQGATVAEKLQQIRPADMESLTDAWQAHKVRNRVAHEGQLFNLDRDTFLKTMAQFERVFKENFII